jgi:DNA processing protein
MTSSARQAPDGLVRQAVELAVRGGGDPERLRAAIAPLLDRPDGVDAAGALAALAARLRSGPDDEERTRAATVRLRELGAGVLLVGYPGYPSRLLDAWPDLGGPLWVFARLTRPVPETPTVAIVGTRHPTLDGLRTATELAALLADHGVTVVSGMARGIDQAAHRGALDAGGRTVAVLGTGLDVDYPRGDGDLREAIATSGGS